MKPVLSFRVRSVLLLTALSALVHLAAVFSFPYLMTGFLAGRLEAKTGKNRFHHAPRPNAEERVVAMPSPDLLYSAGTFDVSDRPLHITAPQPARYVSLSLFAENMDNFFVQNDQQTGNRGFNLVLIGPDGRDPALPGSTCVRSPSATGIMLLRYFAPDDTVLKQVEADRQAVRCEVVP